EDGIRDGHVTGVQTCALPILDDFVLKVGLEPPFSAASREAAWGRSSWASAHRSQASRYCSTCSRNLCPCSICFRASSACSGLKYRDWVLPAIGRVKL